MKPIELPAQPDSTGWTRHGECNGCGWCCQNLIRMQVGVEWKPDIEEYFYECRGVQWVDIEGQRVGLFQGAFNAPCPQHVLAFASPEKRECRIYDRRPLVCRDFPVKPEQIEGTPCSYWFDRRTPEGKHEVMGGQSSPPLLAEAAIRHAQQR